MKISIQSVFSIIMMMVWVSLATYLCIGSLVIIESMEKVKMVENRVEVNIINRLSYANKKNHSYEGAELIIGQIKSQNKDLTFEDEQAIRSLDYAFWYYSFPGYSYISFISILPFIALLFLGAASAGALGSITRIIYNHLNGLTTLKESKFLAHPVFGCFIGIMVLAISIVIPNIFIKGERTLNFTSIVILGFFAGIFSDSFFEGIKNFILKLFKMKT